MTQRPKFSQLIRLEFTSLYQETPLFGDSGGFAVKKTIDHILPPIVQMGLTRQVADWSPKVEYQIPEVSPIKGFAFYGGRERGLLQTITPYSYLAADEWEALQEKGFSKTTEVAVNTIEFIVIEYESGRRTIISSDNGGFWYNFATDEPLDENLINKSYMNTGYDKEIVLHHVVGDVS